MKKNRILSRKVLIPSRDNMERRVRDWMQLWVRIRMDIERIVPIILIDRLTFMRPKIL
jgi:hypothetical protein